MRGDAGTQTGALRSHLARRTSSPVCGGV